MGLISYYVKCYRNPTASALPLLFQTAPTASSPLRYNSNNKVFSLAFGQATCVRFCRQNMYLFWLHFLLKKLHLSLSSYWPSDMTLAFDSQDLTVTTLCYHKGTITTLLLSTNKYNKGGNYPIAIVQKYNKREYTLLF